MKKLVLALLALVIISGPALAQHNDDLIKSIKRRLEHNEKLLQNPKKANDYRLWAKRGKLLLQAYEVNVKYVSPGMAAKLLPLLGLFDMNSGSSGEQQPYYGKPEKIVQEGDHELWVYPKVDFIVKNGVIEGWRIKKPVVKDALLKSYDAYMKAIQLDKKGKFVYRHSTRKELAKLRDYLRAEAITAHYLGDDKRALEYIEKSIALYKYPREKDDTLNMPKGALQYYAGVFAFKAGDYKTAAKYFQQAIDSNYQVGTSYQFLFYAMKKMGEEDKAVKILEQGAKKYPAESAILFTLIDYYKPKGEYDKAFKYIDEAIKLNPNMAILYLAKADAYNTIFEDLQKKYEKLADESDSLKKAAFRARLNPDKQKQILAQKAKVDSELVKTKTDMNKYFNLAIEWFNKGLEKHPKNPGDVYYTIGTIYYNRAMAIFERAQNVPLDQKDKYNQLMGQYKHYMQLALNEFLKAHELEPDDIQTLQTLSIVYRKLGQYDKAKEMRQKIVDLRTKQMKQQQAQQQQNNNNK